MGYDPEVKPDKKAMFKGMAFMIIGNLLFAWVLAHNIAAWQFVPGVKEMGTMTSAINSAIFIWLVFIFRVNWVLRFGKKTLENYLVLMRIKS